MVNVLQYLPPEVAPSTVERVAVVGTTVGAPPVPEPAVTTGVVGHPRPSMPEVVGCPCPLQCRLLLAAPMATKWGVTAAVAPVRTGVRT